MPLINLHILNFFLCFALIYLNFKYRYQISKKFQIIDIPDGKRKLHKGPTPLNGSVWFVIMLCIFLVESFFLDNFLSKQIKLIIVTTILMFLIGFVDDRKSLKANLRLIIYFSIFYVAVSFDESFLLKTILFESLDLELQTLIFANFISAFCLTAFINSINLTDGINALANSILTLILFFVFITFDQNNVQIITLLIFLSLNSFVIYKQKYFLGDAGSLSISTFVGMYIIYLYNSEYLGMYNSTFNAEDIFVLMAFPGLDMMRVFFERLVINKKNPFLPSRDHLHHYLLKKHSLFVTLLLYLVFAFAPSISNFIIKTLTTYNLIICFVLYIVLLKYARHNNKFIIK